MANIVFSNNTTGLHELFYDSHAQLLRMLALELGAEDKIDYLQEKFLGKKRKMKKLKNPYAPRKPKSSYFFFCDEHRRDLINKYKTKTKTKHDKNMMGQVAKDLGVMWKALENKDKYTDMSVEDKKRYESEMNGFNEKYG